MCAAATHTTLLTNCCACLPPASFHAGELVGSSTGANKIRLETNLRSHLPQDGLPEPLYELEPAAEAAPATATATV
jgi:hypothetical protein